MTSASSFAALFLASLLLLPSAACGGARPAPRTVLAERFETPEAEEASQRAPDLYAAAERARVAAVRADDAGRREAAEDHATRARMLLDTAIAEAERLDLEAARVRIEAETEELALEYGNAVSARDAVLEEVRRHAAASVAGEQAAMAFAQAVVDEERRYRGRSEERAALHVEAARVLGRRARLLAAAARALEAEPESLEAVTELLDRAAAAGDPAGKLQLTERALRAALAALGSARRRQDGPTADERVALTEAATAAGFIVEQGDRGLTLRVPDVYRGASAAPSPAGARRLARLAAILTAHPHGAVQIAAYATSGSGAGRRRAATARATRAVAVLTRSEDVATERLTAEGRVDEAQDDALSSVEATFLAYGPSLQ